MSTRVIVSLSRSMISMLSALTVGHPVAFEIHGGDDGLAGLTRLGTEVAHHFHHVHDGAAGDLGSLLVGVVSKQKRRCGQGEGEDQGNAGRKHTHGKASIGNRRV